MDTKINPDQWKKIKKLYEGGILLKTLNKKFGISISRMSEKLRKMGTKMRPSVFRIGGNAWSNLTKKVADKRKKEFSIRMSKYNPMKNRITAQKVAKKLRKKLGFKNPNYKHGKSSYKVKSLTPRERIKLLTERKVECVNCKETEPITPHHIDGDRGNCNRKNLIILCANCHYKRHYGIRPLVPFLLKLRKKLLPRELIRRRYEKTIRRYCDFDEEYQN
jgi:hypothetical protein